MEEEIKTTTTSEEEMQPPVPKPWKPESVLAEKPSENGRAWHAKKTIDFSDRVFVLALLLVIGFVFSYVGTTIYYFSNLPQNAPQQIMVSGNGKTYVKPDIAMVSLGMTTEAAQSQDAVNNNNTVMNAVTQGIEALGVLPSDIQTTSYDLSPVYDYSDKGVSTLSGYSLTQQISVKIRDFSKISMILDKATSLGANTVGDLQFTVDNPLASENAARANAIANAKAQAMSIASQSGLHLVRLVTISEGGQPTPPVPMYTPMGAMASVASVAPQVQTGQMEVDSTVTLTYLVK